MIPSELLYTPSHEWAKIDGDTALLGITQFAQEQLGDITFVDLPAPGAVLIQGEEMGSIESVKAATELYSPVSGTVIETNPALDANPELVNQDPYGAGWMLKVRLTAKPTDLLDAKAYTIIAQISH
jgi:glycine cleavage system H protein